MDIDKAITDPASQFDSPEAVVDNEDLTLEQKKAILVRWQHDAKQLAEAEAENMAGGEPNLMHRVSVALSQLGEQADIPPHPSSSK